MHLASHIADATSPIPNLTNQVASEFCAEFAAMEFLFPLSERERAIKAGNGTLNFGTIAARYGIPEFLVQKYCGEPAMDYFRSIDQDINI